MFAWMRENQFSLRVLPLLGQVFYNAYPMHWTWWFLLGFKRLLTTHGFSELILILEFVFINPLILWVFIENLLNLKFTFGESVIFIILIMLTHKDKLSFTFLLSFPITSDILRVFVVAILAVVLVLEVFHHLV